MLFCGSYRFDADLFSSGDVAGIPAGSAGISDPPEGRAWGSKTSEFCNPHVLAGSNSKSIDQSPGSDTAWNVFEPVDHTGGYRLWHHSGTVTGGTDPVVRLLQRSYDQ